MRVDDEPSGKPRAQFLKLEAPHGTDSSQTPRWREMDSNYWYRGTKAVNFRSIPGIAGVSAGLLNDPPHGSAFLLLLRLDHSIEPGWGTV